MTEEARIANTARMRFQGHMLTERDNALAHYNRCVKAKDLEGAAAWWQYAQLLNRAFSEWGKPLEGE